MKFLIFLALVCLAHAGVISHDHGIDHHERATSYQNIHMEHFYPVPTYIRKEDKHLLEHPVSLGSSSSKVEVHHGDKHDHGYAIASAENNIHGHGYDGLDGGLSSGGHEDAGYQVHDQGNEYSHYQGQLGHAGAALEQFRLSSAAQEYASLEAAEHGQAYDNHD